MGRRRIEAIRGDQQVDRPRRLVQEHRAYPAAAFLVLARLVDQRLEEVQAAFPIGVLLTDRVGPQALYGRLPVARADSVLRGEPGCSSISGLFVQAGACWP